jgi:hypothetical protein
LFAYAQGYGIRILDSYINVLKKYKAGENDPSLDLDEIAIEARDWTETVVDRYLRRGHKNTLSYIETYTPRGRNSMASTSPIFSHTLLETRKQKTIEPGSRDCLTGFSLLMRHVRLWEMGIEGKAR